MNFKPQLHNRYEVVHNLFEAFLNNGYQLFLVGGAVREVILQHLGSPFGKSIDQQKDLDFATSATPEQTISVLKQAGFATYDIGKDFGTIGSVLFATQNDDPSAFPKDIQITTFRSEESYTKGSRHPTVAYGKTINDDLWRRDFSINSIALDHNGDLVDPYNGLDDLKNQRLRVVNDPNITLAEDPLRILRAARFHARLNFTVDPQLQHAISQHTNDLLQISHERWLQEMDKLLIAPFAAEGLQFLLHTGALSVILPELTNTISSQDDAKWLQTLTFLTNLNRCSKILPHSYFQPGDFQPTNWFAHEISWAALMLQILGDHYTEDQVHQLVPSLTTNFTMSNASRTFLQQLLVAHSQTLQLLECQHPDDAMIRHFEDFATPYAPLFCLFWGIKHNLQSPQIVQKRRFELAEIGSLRPSLPKGIGKAIIKALQIEPGPAIGHAKETLKNAILNGDILNNQSTNYYVNFLLREKKLWN